MKLRRTVAVAFLPATIAAGAAAYALQRISDYDVWFHLTVGELFLSTGRLPAAADPFSWTRLGEPWLAHSWLAQAGLALANRLAGLNGLALLAAALLAGATLLAWKLGRSRQVNPWLLSVLLAAGVFAASPSFTPRPQLFAYLLAPLLVHLLDLSRRGRRWPLAAIPVLLAAWANLHGSVILGVSLAAVVVAGDALAQAFSRRGESWLVATATSRAALIQSAAAVAVGVAATGLNPLGWKILASPWLLNLGTVRSLIVEWLPATSGLDVVPVIAFFGLLFLSFSLLLLATLRRGAVVNAGDALMVAVLGLLALLFRRQIPFFCLVGVPVAASFIPAIRSGLGRPWLGRLVVTLGAAAAVAGTALSLSHATWPVSVRPHLLPERSAELLRETYLPGRLVNSYDWGFYLINRLWPQYLVSVDGRSELHGQALAEILRMERAEGDWQTTFGALQADVALLTSRLPGDGLARALASSSDWSFVYWDETQSLLVRRNSPAEAAAGQTFASLNPFVADGARGGRYREAEGEYRQLLQRWPDDAGAWAALGNLYLHGLGDVAAAEPCFRRAAELNPELGFARFGLGLVAVASGRGREAVTEFLAARRLAPDLIEAEKNAGVVYRDLLASPQRAARHLRRYLQLLDQTGRQDPERPAIELYLKLTENSK